MEQQAEQKKKNKKPILILGVLLLLMAGAGIYYWIHSSYYATTNDAQLDGDIYAINSSVNAYLKEIEFKDNQHVQKGDTLFVFDTIQLKAMVEEAKSALEKAKSNLSSSDRKAFASQQNAQSSQENILSLQEEVIAAKAKYDKAKKDFTRSKSLRKIEAITQAKFDADSTILAQTKAAYKQTVHQQKSSKSSFSSLLSQAEAAHQQISAAMALVAQREAKLTAAEDQLKHAFVLAPTDGVVSKRSVNAGQYISSGQALCTVIDQENLWVTANFKETKLKSIRPGQPVNIHVDAYPNLDLKGTVESYGGATGAKFALIPPDNATGNFIKVTQRFPLRIKIKDFFNSYNKPNGRTDKPTLFPGLSVDVKIKIK